MKIDILEKIYTILFEIRPEIDFKNSTDFSDSGALDSLDIIRLVVALEEVFSISIDGSEIVPENFNTIEGIANLAIKTLGKN